MKLKSLRRFLDEGHQVRLQVQFKGREIVHPEIGENVLASLVLSLPMGIGSVQGKPVLDGKRMTLVIHPRKRG